MENAINRKFQELGVTLNHSVGAVVEQVDLSQSFQPIHDTVVNTVGLEDFKRSLRASLDYMRFRFDGIADIILESALEMLQPVSDAAHIIATAPVDENGFTDIGDNAEIVEKAVETVCNHMSEEQKESFFQKVKKKIPRKLSADAKKTIIGALIPFALQIFANHLPNSQISKLIDAQNQQNERQAAIIEILLEEIALNRKANSLQEEVNKLVNAEKEKSDELIRDFQKFAADFNAMADELANNAGE